MGVDSLINKNFIGGFLVKFSEDLRMVLEGVVGVEILEVNLLGLVVGVVVFEEYLALWVYKWII